MRQQHAAPEPQNASRDSRSRDDRRRRRSTDRAGPDAALQRSVGNQAVQHLYQRGELQAKTRGQRQHDPAEREAEAVAETVTNASQTSIGTSTAGDDSSRGTRNGVQRQATERDTGSSSVASKLPIPGRGSSLSESVRNRIEPVLGADLSGVSVHAGPAASGAASAIGARAFTHRNHIVLGDGESASDVHLMAHEATHVVQQGAASGGTTRATSKATVQPFLSGSVMDRVNEFAHHIPGWKLFTTLIEYNPLTGGSVTRTAKTLLEGLFDLIPRGDEILDALRDFEIFQDAFTWVEDQLSGLDISIGRITDAIEGAADDFSFGRTLLSRGEHAKEVLETHFGPLVDEVRAFVRSLRDGVIDLIRAAATPVVESLLDTRPWNLLTQMLEYDPLRGVEVEASPKAILEDTLLLVGADDHLEKLREENMVEETAEWLATKIGRFMDLLGRLRGLVDDTLATLSPANLPNLRSNLTSLATDVGEFLTDVTDFARDVMSAVLERIKDALLGRLDGFARANVPGYKLLTAIIQRNPFTGERVARTAAALIGGFITLLPNGREIYQELTDAGVIEQAGARIDEAVDQLGISWDLIVELFESVWDTLSIDDLLDPIGAFERVVAKFGEPIARLVRFVSIVLREIFHIALKAMGFPTKLVSGIISHAMTAIEAIRSDPIGFLLNMLEAVKLGFTNFFDNAVTHVVGGLTEWLFRGLRDAGVQPPRDFSLGSVLEFVLGVIGVTTDRLWEGVADRIGEENVERIKGAIDTVTGIWSFIRDVQRDGVSAIWAYVTNQLRGLWDTVLDAAREWIMVRVITRAARWLAGLLDPSGVTAVINSFQAFFNAIQSAMEYFRDILGIVSDYVATIAHVAQGQLTTGAEMLEQGLANTIPIAIGFLANQLGLGNIGKRIKKIVEGIRERVDPAIEWLLDQAERGLESVMRAIGIGGEEEEGSEPRVQSGDHSELARSAAESFEETPLTGYETPLLAAEAYAKEHEPVLSDQLEEGIQLTFRFDDDPSQLADGRLGYTVVIAPNTTNESGDKNICPSLDESANGIGNIATHGSQPPRNRDGPRIHHTQSEHIIPFATARSLRLAVGFSERSRDILRRFDQGMVTLMIYRGAAELKNNRDNELSEQFEAEMVKAEIPERIDRARIIYVGGNESDAESILMDAESALVAALEGLRKDAVERTQNFIHEEWVFISPECSHSNGKRRGEGNPVPGDTKVVSASKEQYDGIVELVAKGLHAKELQELEQPTWEGRTMDEPGIKESLVETGYDKPYQHPSGTWVIGRRSEPMLRNLTVDENGVIHHQEG